jgi:hypothetical protein
MKPKIFVIYTDKWKLKVYDFSTIQLAQQFIQTLDTKDYVIFVGHMANEGIKGI